ncbi:hypothetical protein L195_g031689, partial [Trifolium pratense]
MKVFTSCGQYAYRARASADNGDDDALKSVPEFDIIA